VKRAIVIGASSGFGRAIADRLADTGWIPARLARSYGFDVRSENAVKRTFQSSPFPIDAVIYSAGLAIDKRSIERGASDDWHQVFETNAIALLTVLREATPHLRSTRGHFIYIGSIASRLAYEGGSDYCASKAAARTIMETYRAEVGGSGIRSTLIEPGLGATNFQLARYNGDATKAAAHSTGIKQLDPEDVANAVSWVLDLPRHVNIDELVIKPTEQISHGKLAPTSR
jgi:3-hydroxy acid dehydrogenase / malonic semialdehyde reductase